MVEAILTQDKSNNTNFIWFFLFFIAMIAICVVTGHTFLGVQDEVQLQSTLAAGDPRNYMMSYPLNVLVSFLYTHIPQVQWYSVMVSLYLLVIILLMSWHITKIEYSKIIKYLVFFLFTSIILLILFDVTVTIISLMLIVLSIPLIRENQLYFWILLYIASLLRVEMIVNISPLIFLVYLILVKKSFFTMKNTFIILVLILGMTLNYVSSSFDKEYKEWLTFQKSRIYFNDKKGTNKKHILTEDEYNLVRSWWINDLELYPVDKVIEAANSNIDVMLDVVLTKNVIRKVLRKAYYNPILILLILLTLYSMYIEKNNIRRGYYFIFMVGFFSLIFVKDVQRTTTPVILLWSMWLFIILQHWHKEFLTKVLLIALTVFIISDTSWIKVINYNKNEILLKEFKTLVERNKNMTLETPSGFFSSWKLTQKMLEQNHLYYEKEGLNYNENLVLAQWFTMHPLFFKQHNITFKDIKRKYRNYYEYLLNENTGTIGSKNKDGFNPFLKNNLLRIYDEKFMMKRKCHHVIKVVDESEHFIIKQMRIECQ